MWNTGLGAQPLAGWSLRAGTKQATFPLTTTLTLAPGARIWCTANTDSFRHSFGLEAGCGWITVDEEALHLTGALTLVNTGGAISLLDADQTAVDVLLYGETTLQPTGWQGWPGRVIYTGVGDKHRQALFGNASSTHAAGCHSTVIRRKTGLAIW